MLDRRKVQTSRERLEQALVRIADPKGEGARACLTLYADVARKAADSAGERAKRGASIGPLDGVIFTIKDLFDVAGEKTRAGSKVLADEAEPAKADAPIVARLKMAGAVIVAKTNMTEFAFSALGLNPHFGTPGNPADRSRAPGGSSSGAAVAIADGMCEIGIGSDTGGSTRIPAALCGITGFKPSKQRVPTDGAFPLSSTLDSIGPMAMNVRDCALADAVMADEKPAEIEPLPLSGLRIAVAQGRPLNGLDDTVSKAFAAALGALGKAGARLSDAQFPVFEEMASIYARGGLIPAEALAVHRDRIKRRLNDIDPNVGVRMERARTMSAIDYIGFQDERRRLVRALDQQLSEFDVMAMPTTPIVSPRMADVATPETFAAANLTLLRNTAIGNFFDLCAISLPLPRDGGLPVGLMLLARNGQDKMLFRIAAAAESALGG